MKKNNCGISLITLIITIVVIIILSSILIFNGMNALDDASDAKNQNEINAIEEAIAIRYASYIKNDKNVSLIGSSASSRWASAEECCNAIYKSLDLEGYTEIEKQEYKDKIAREIGRDYNEYVKIVNVSQAKQLGVDSVAENHIFVVNYFTASAYGPIESE